MKKTYRTADLLEFIDDMGCRIKDDFPIVEEEEKIKEIKKRLVESNVMKSKKNLMNESMSHKNYKKRSEEILLEDPKVNTITIGGKMYLIEKLLNGKLRVLTCVFRKVGREWSHVFNDMKEVKAHIKEEFESNCFACYMPQLEKEREEGIAKRK